VDTAPSACRDPRDDASLSHDQVFALQEDKTERCGRTNGGGICCRPPGGTFRQYRHDPLNPRSVSDEIRAIYAPPGEDRHLRRRR
jgi:hypothetical protein